MCITQTVEIPESRRLVLDVPREVPAGQVILTFTPAPAVLEEMWGGDSGVPMSVEEALEMGRGIGKRLGSTLTSAQSIAWRQEDRELEEAEYQRRHQNKKAGR